MLPNKWQKATRSISRAGVSPKGEAYLRYFQDLVDELREKHRFTKARVAFAQNWYSFPAGIPGITYGTSFPQGDRIRAEVYIDLKDQDTNKKVFDSLLRRRREIEQSFGAELSWERLDDRRACRIAIYRPGNIDCDENVLTEIHSWAIEQLLRFRDVFGPILRKEVDTSGA